MRLTTALAGIVLASTLATPASAKIWQQNWTVPGRANVHIVTNDGHVRVHVGPAGTVSAHISHDVQVWGWSSASHDPLVEMRQDGSQVTITARTRGNLVVFGGVNEKFEIDVTLPSECDLDVRSGDGGVDVEPVHGRISLETGDGHLHASGLHGDLRLWTGDGGIDANELDGTLSARSGDGHLRVSGRFDRLELRTGDGSLEASVARGSKLTEPWSVETGDGSLLVRIPKNLQAMLDAHTADGHLRVDLPITVRGDVSGHDLRGALNEGSVPLRLRTGDGSLTLALSE